MKLLTVLFLIVVVSLLPFTNAAFPKSVKSGPGSHKTNSDIAALKTKDLTGTQQDLDKSYQLKPKSNGKYTGIFTLKFSTSSSTVQASSYKLQFKAHFKANRASDTWKFQVKNFESNSWKTVFSSASTTSWKSRSKTLSNSVHEYLDGKTMKFRIKTTNANKNAFLDYLKVTLKQTASGESYPPLGNDACDGYATRYWDCCKPHCSWPDNVPNGVTSTAHCDVNSNPLSNAFTTSACNGPADDRSYTCLNMVPWAVTDSLSYGFAAVPVVNSNDDICGRCYQLEFPGTTWNQGSDAGSAAIAGKTMIVQATNIGHDVANSQFDLLIPGGGVGLFDACTYQWGVDSSSELGEQYGGFLLKCKKDFNYQGTHTQHKDCVRERCTTLFPAGSYLRRGCEWFIDWYEVADNPRVRYQEVVCPQALIDLSGTDRRSLNDQEQCTGDGGGGSSCSQEEQDNCDCSWTNGGANCGTDDGSCCWTACCA